VFWPILTARFDEIFVTKEITITRENREFSQLEEEDDLESHQPGRKRSDLSIKKEYSGAYKLQQVDPLREDKKWTMAITSVSVGEEIGHSQQSSMGNRLPIMVKPILGKRQPPRAPSARSDHSGIAMVGPRRSSDSAKIERFTDYQL
jgi:hypothetical protein